jgi:hypothetical protein
MTGFDSDELNPAYFRIVNAVNPASLKKSGYKSFKCYAKIFF